MYLTVHSHFLNGGQGWGGWGDQKVNRKITLPASDLAEPQGGDLEKLDNFSSPKATVSNGIFLYSFY
jgi:hypothetical protein